MLPQFNFGANSNLGEFQAQNWPDPAELGVSHLCACI